MSLRSRLLASIVTIFVLTVGLLAFSTVMARKEEAHVRRLLHVHHLYTSLLELKIAINRHLTEAQAIFIYGKKADPHDFTEAAREVGERFAAIGGLLSDHDLEGNGRGAWLTNLRQEYTLVHQELQLMVRLIAMGRDNKAREHFSSVIVRRFNHLFSGIDARIAAQRRRLDTIEASFLRINRQGNYAVIGALAVVMVVISVIGAVLLHAFGPRLRELLRGTERIAAGDLRTPVPVSGGDEFARLAGAMNRMMTDLAASRKELLAQSYYAGIADMVAGTLHNIGNSLAPVIADLDALDGRLRKMDNPRAVQAAAEIAAASQGPDRLRALGEYLELFSRQLAEDCAASLAHLTAVRQKIGLIETMLHDQRHTAITRRPLEEAGLGEMISDAVGLIHSGEVEIVVAAGLEEITLLTQRIVFVQVVANLVQNGVEAIARSEKGGGRVEISADLERAGKELHLVVRDNGVGIEAARLERIFGRGVSTKARPSGLGLHWCANAVRALGGRIEAASDGPGTGAAFHVRLPVAGGDGSPS